jgi:hypothetical protein
MAPWTRQVAAAEDARRSAEQTAAEAGAAAAAVARGESVIRCPSTLNALNNSYDRMYL